MRRQSGGVLRRHPLQPGGGKAAEGADLLIHEAFCVADSVLASSAGHCTGGEAGQVAAEARVASLVLTHLTDAYHLDPEPLGVEAAQFYSAHHYGHDCMQITLE